MENQYRTIDTKIKEIYFEAHLANEAEDTVESRTKFWTCLNVMAAQNMSLQQVRVRA